MGMIALFFFLTLTFMMLGICKLGPAFRRDTPLTNYLSAAEFVPSAAAGCTKAGGALGIITAFIAYYVGASQLLAGNDIWFTLPVGSIPKRV